MRQSSAFYKPLESDVLRTCLAVLSLKGVFHWRNNSGAYEQEGGRFVRYGFKGSSDIIALHPDGGRLWAIEVKRPGGRLSDAQVSFLRSVRMHGGVATVAESPEDVLRSIVDSSATSHGRYESAIGFPPSGISRRASSGA